MLLLGNHIGMQLTPSQACEVGGNWRKLLDTGDPPIISQYKLAHALLSNYTGMQSNLKHFLSTGPWRQCSRRKQENPPTDAATGSGLREEVEKLTVGASNHPTSAIPFTVALLVGSWTCTHVVFNCLFCLAKRQKQLQWLNLMSAMIRKQDMSSILPYPLAMYDGTCTVLVQVVSSLDDIDPCVYNTCTYMYIIILFPSLLTTHQS